MDEDSDNSDINSNWQVVSSPIRKTNKSCQSGSPNVIENKKQFLINSNQQQTKLNLDKNNGNTSSNSRIPIL